MQGLIQEYNQKLDESFPLNPRIILKLCHEKDMKITGNFEHRHKLYVKKMNNHYQIL